MGAVDEELEKMRRKSEQWGKIRSRYNLTEPQEQQPTISLDPQVKSLQQELHKLKQENVNLRRRQEKEIIALRLEIEYLHSAAFCREPVRREALPSWIMQNLKFLIFACHPDRNSGKIAAEEVTKALLNLKE